jgi:endonuclease/exonuclease/phosphatase family metal-dependent hydrolase
VQISRTGGRGRTVAAVTRPEPAGPALRVGTLNLASGRGPSGRPLAAADLAAAVTGLDADVLALQEVDAAQPRSHGVDQAAVVAGALGAAHWRAAATLHGTPSPFRSWAAADPGLRGPGQALDGPAYGVALLSRRPVRRWSVLGLGAGRGRLPMQAPDPRTGRRRLWWFPDEPRVAVAAELDGVTVVATHLSFAPHTAVRQLLRLRAWAHRLPGPLVVAGDLNLPGGLPARLLGGRRLVSGPSFPAAEPRVQLDHLVAVGALAGCGPETRVLAVGDHRALLASVLPG